MNQTPEELARKIEDARARQARETATPESEASAGNSEGASGLRVATDLVAGVATGVFLGYWIDRWLGSGPWGMIIFLFLGFGAGFVNITRAEAGEDFRVGYKRETKDKED